VKRQNLEKEYFIGRLYPAQTSRRTRILGVEKFKYNLFSLICCMKLKNGGVWKDEQKD